MSKSIYLCLNLFIYIHIHLICTCIIQQQPTDNGAENLTEEFYLFITDSSYNTLTYMYTYIIYIYVYLYILINK